MCCPTPGRKYWMLTTNHRMLPAWHVILITEADACSLLQWHQVHLYRHFSSEQAVALEVIPPSPPLLARWFALLGSHRAHDIDTSRLKIHQKINLRSTHDVLLPLWVLCSWDQIRGNLKYTFYMHIAWVLGSATLTVSIYRSTWIASHYLVM